MLSTREGVATAPGQGADPGAGRQSDGHGGAQSAEERRQGLGVQEWPDGSRYEGEFVNGFKHGKGRYTWGHGEYYEGSFYKDYRHGGGLYCWPTGHKFTGKFYLNRKEGYGQQMFPDGATFQGLYHAEQRFGPGIIAYPDGRKDVGLWLGERLLKLCTPVKEGFSLKSFSEYAAYMDPAVITDSLTQPPNNGSHTEPRTTSEVHVDRDLLSDEKFILPPGMESYSTDGDHLPLPPGRRRELDQHFYGELWEPDVNPHQGYERDLLSTLPLQARMQAHIHKHRLQAKTVAWDVAAVLSLNRDSFGPKGPLEVSSELLIQHASQGELQAVSQILRAGLVHPDVADSQGHTALIAATVNCHNDVIQLLLDMGADIDKLNCEGMSALAVCHVLYYPFQSLNTTLCETSAKARVLRSPSECGNSLQISQVDFTTDTSRKRDELMEHILHNSTNECETPGHTDHLQEEERKEKERGEEKDCKEIEGNVRKREESCCRAGDEPKGEQREIERRCDQTQGNGENVINEKEREFKKREEDTEVGERRENGSRKESMETREEIEEDIERTARDTQEEDIKEREDRGSEDVLGVKQGKDKVLTQEQPFDSTCSVSNYKIQVTEEVMQRSAEALSRTENPHSSDTQETACKMAAMKTEHCFRMNTLKLLLERGADPNISRVPMPVLFLAIMAADTEAVRRLLLHGAHTDIPLPLERKGLYPLHVAAALPGPAGSRITELLLHALADPDAQACDQDEIYEPDKAQEPLNTDGNPHLREGGRTALHVACQRDSDYRNASKVVSLLLSHRASTALLWSGHSPLSLAIASGNDLAVEELLKGGADPSIPLGRRVGSALCALANFSYHLCGNRAKLLSMLAKAGADILMPVTVGAVVGTAVDYAHYSFNQDLRIATTPFHALNMREREIFKERHQLLGMMVELLRQTAGPKERENSEEEHNLTLNNTSGKKRFVYMGADAISSNGPLTSCESLSPLTERRRKAVFKFCYHCGRSVSVKLAPCRGCHQVLYCSMICKLKAWEGRHKEECIKRSQGLSLQQLNPSKPKNTSHQTIWKLKPEKSTSGDGIQKTVAPGPRRTLTAMVKSGTGSLAVRCYSAPKPVSIAENIVEVNLKENYSCN